MKQTEFEDLIWCSMHGGQDHSREMEYAHPKLLSGRRRHDDFAMFYHNDFIGYICRMNLAEYVRYLKMKKIDLTSLRFHNSD